MTDAIILAGGLGTRLRPLLDLPKSLAPLGKEPILSHILRNIAKFPAVKRVVISVGYEKEKIMQAYWEHNFPLEILFAEEDEPLGTGGGARNALKYVQTEDVLIFNGDTLLDLNIDSFLLDYREKRADILLSFGEIEDGSRYGKVLLDSLCERILGFVEKDGLHEPGLISHGVYCMKKRLLEEIEEKAFSLEHDLFPKLLSKRFFGYYCPERFIDIGTPESYLEALSQT